MKDRILDDTRKGSPDIRHPVKTDFPGGLVVRTPCFCSRGHRGGTKILGVVCHSLKEQIEFQINDGYFNISMVQVWHGIYLNGKPFLLFSEIQI